LHCNCGTGIFLPLNLFRYENPFYRSLHGSVRSARRMQHYS
jgi:hypothetical protein